MLLKVALNFRSSIDLFGLTHENLLINFETIAKHSRL